MAVGLPLLLCEYSKFWIESNSYFRIWFDSKRAQLFKIFEHLPSPISYLFNRRRFFTLATTPTTNKICCYQWSRSCISFKCLRLAHYGSPSTETPAIDTTIVRCHKNSWINLTGTYLLLVSFETNDNYSIRFEISNDSSTIRFEVKKHYSHRTSCHHGTPIWLEKFTIGKKWKPVKWKLEQLQLLLLLLLLLCLSHSWSGGQVTSPILSRKLHRGLGSL